MPGRGDKVLSMTHHALTFLEEQSQNNSFDTLAGLFISGVILF